MTAPRNTRGTVVIGSTESDAHVVPIFLLSLELENRGYRVENLRCFNSAQSFAEAAGRFRPMRWSFPTTTGRPMTTCTG